MSVTTSEELTTQSSDVSSEAILEVKQVSKIYHLWESPRARLAYGLWSQVPSWFPKAVQRLAQRRKALLGRDFYALRNVSFQINRSECAAILGRNGSGKSTLLQIICGVLQPTSGLASRKCTRVAALLELGSGFNPEFTGRENVYLNGAVLGLSKAEMDAKFERILEFAEISEFIDQPVRTYSSGMMVRLAFSVQVLLDPELLIIDEALSVGDIFFQQKCFALIRELIERGVTVLFVSHDMNAIRKLCSRAIVLADGQVVFDGDPVSGISKFFILNDRIGSSQKLPNPADREKLISPALGSFDDYFAVNLATTARESLGNRGADIPKVAVFNVAGAHSTVIGVGEDVTIRFLVSANRTIDRFNAGIHLFDRTNTLIFSSSLWHQNSVRHNLAEGQTALVTFRLNLPLAPGEYTFGIGVAEPLNEADAAGETLCRIHGLGPITVVSTAIGREDFHGMVRLPFATKVEKVS
jgi:lipopolysaccharide transport system ATP-binding protein